MTHNREGRDAEGDMGVVWGGGDDVRIDSAGRECLTAERGEMLREHRGSMERGR